MATLADVLRAATRQLDAERIDAPAHTARVLLCQALGKPRSWLLAHDDETPSADAQATFDALLRRVVAHEPMFYVLGRREFFGLDFLIDKRVLIPRPETEMLVELALAALKTHAATTLYDIGTGSGVIPISVAATHLAARVVACDVSTDALDVARINAERLGVANRVTFVHSDLLAGLPGLPAVLTANLPYVTREEIDGLPAEIQDHEPRVALDGGVDGLDLVRALLAQIAARHGADSPLRAAFFEIGASQGRAAVAAARACFPVARIEMLKDLGRRDRVLSLRWV